MCIRACGIYVSLVNCSFYVLEQSTLCLWQIFHNTFGFTESFFLARLTEPKLLSCPIIENNNCQSLQLKKAITKLSFSFWGNYNYQQDCHFIKNDWYADCFPFTLNDEFVSLMVEARYPPRVYEGKQSTLTPGKGNQPFLIRVGTVLRAVVVYN